jgi:prepilin-type N-terminal cleavage/methylation domain-containing protein
LGPGILPAGRSAQTGATLLELLIALAIAGIIALGLYAFFGATFQTYTDQTATARMIQNATTAMTMITKDIRMAGISSSTACAQVALVPLVRADNASGGTITIWIATDDPTTRTEVAPPGQSQSSPTLRVLSTAGFAVGNLALITDGVQCTGFLVTGVVGGTPPGLVHIPALDSNSPGGDSYLYPAPSSLVHRLGTTRRITYRVEAPGPTARWLTRETQVCVPLCTGAGPVRVVPDIESLRFSYRDNAGATINDPSPIDTAPEAATIRLVNVTVTSRAERPSRLVGGDGFRRHILTSSIQLRNLRQ